MEVLNLIIHGSDWESVLKEIIIEKGLDPWNIEIRILTDSFLEYLSKLKIINFRIPARFILISAILLRLKSETLIKEEKEEKELEKIDIEDLELLEPPINRIPKRNITFEELTTILKRVVESTTRKEEIIRNKKQKINDLKKLIEFKIDDYVERVYRELKKIRQITFYNLTKDKDNLETAKYFIAILHLATKQNIEIYQEQLFGDIYIKARLP
ncbi:MAG: hypothetical protein B6U88_02455 [Candidatus Aenigmarchaeota archaeon ex4484_56]|nr:MAG: hypothetical protein B6U88_02455 [Candidatus Aenigmarchaeota archaeon ex4484_56]